MVKQLEGKGHVADVGGRVWISFPLLLAIGCVLSARKLVLSCPSIRGTGWAHCYALRIDGDALEAVAWLGELAQCFLGLGRLSSPVERQDERDLFLLVLYDSGMCRRYLRGVAPLLLAMDSFAVCPGLMLSDRAAPQPALASEAGRQAMPGRKEGRPRPRSCAVLILGESLWRCSRCLESFVKNLVPDTMDTGECYACCC